jgi:single-strand DNA-binding protein
MPSVATATVLGHLGGEPVLKITPKGTSVYSMNVAVNDGNQEQPHTTWYRVAVWGGYAERVADMGLANGDLVQVSGKLSSREYQRRDGQQSIDFDLRADHVIPLHGRRRDADDAVPF